MMGCQERHNARDMLDRPNEWVSPLPVVLVREPRLILARLTSLLLPSPSIRGLPSPCWCGFVHGP
jgi:hypothetical protein